MITRQMISNISSSYMAMLDGSFVVLSSLVIPRGHPLESLDGITKVHSYMSLRGLHSLSTLGNTLTHVRSELAIEDCPLLRSLGGVLKYVGSLDIRESSVYSLPSDLAVERGYVWMTTEDRSLTKYTVAEAQCTLQDFKDSIKCSDDAGEILLDRMNRPLWQVAYATDYLNGDIQV